MYIIIEGQVKRYPGSIETEGYIKNLISNHDACTNDDPSMSFNQKISNVADEEREYLVKELKIMTRGEICGNLPNKIEKSNCYQYFDVADSCLQVAVLTHRTYNNMLGEDPDLHNKIETYYLKYYETYIDPSSNNNQKSNYLNFQENRKSGNDPSLKVNLTAKHLEKSSTSFLKNDSNSYSNRVYQESNTLLNNLQKSQVVKDRASEFSSFNFKFGFSSPFEPNMIEEQ